MRKKSWNPSSWGQRIAVSCFALCAVVLATWMSLYQWGLLFDIWDPVFFDQTKKVLQSDVSHHLYVLARIPDAALGAFAYLADIFLSLAGSNRRWYDRPWMVFLFAVNVIPIGLVSAILVALQGTVVGAYCFLCLLTALLSIVIAAFGYNETRYCIEFLIRLWKQTHNKQLLWSTFWGHPSDEAYRVVQEMEGEHVGARR